MKRIALLAIACLLPGCTEHQEGEEAVAVQTVPPLPAPPEHSPDLWEGYRTLLEQFVHQGRIDYAGLKNEEDSLDAVLDAIATVEPETLDRPHLVAFWINAYNAITLKLILEHLPSIESIKDIPSGQRWKDERWIIHGKGYSLDHIEHEILRPLGDPRIHFALVCAALSCPDLRPEPYMPETLDEQLHDAGETFLGNREKGAATAMEEGIFSTSPTLRISKIFDWFEGDFEERAGSVVDFVLAYLPQEEASFVRKHRDDLDIAYFDYDWSLNKP